MKSTVMHIVVIIAAVIIGSAIAGYMHEEQGKQMPYKSLESTAPIGGFHKFASDIDWMFVIQYMGGLKSVSKENVDEVIRRFEKIVSYDPNFENAYQIGAMSFSVENPDKAVEFLERACNNPQMKSNWKLPFYAGFILTHSGKDDPDKVKKAIGFYEMAIKRSATPEMYVVNSYLRAKAKSMGLNNDKLAMLKILYGEWKKNSGMREIETSSIIPDLNQRILKAAQEARREYPDDKELTEFSEKIMKEVFKDQHICTSCLSIYAPGDKFCSCCGNSVQVFGTCPKCGNVLKGAFCNKCGTKAPSVVIKKASAELPAGMDIPPAAAKPAASAPKAAK